MAYVGWSKQTRLADLTSPLLNLHLHCLSFFSDHSHVLPAPAPSSSPLSSSFDPPQMRQKAYLPKRYLAGRFRPRSCPSAQTQPYSAALQSILRWLPFSERAITVPG